MTGIGTWTATVNTIYIKGDVTIIISENNGEYDVAVELPGRFAAAKLSFSEITADGETLRGKGELMLNPKRSLSAEAEITFDGDEFTGSIKITMAGVIKLKNGHRI